MVVFFFQAEDGIRDIGVTGVQTCALPIFAACRTPVVTAVGHETDTTLVDHAADVRAATPTDAAHRVVPEIGEQRRLDRKSTRLNSSHANISYAVFCLKKKKT